MNAIAPIPTLLNPRRPALKRKYIKSRGAKSKKRSCIRPNKEMKNPANSADGAKIGFPNAAIAQLTAHRDFLRNLLHFLRVADQ